MRKRAWLIALAVALLAASVLWLPWAFDERPVTASTPVPPPLFSVAPVPLEAGQTACWNNIVLTPSSQSGEIGLKTGGAAGPPLSITAKGSGYESHSQIAAGYGDRPSLRFAVVPP